MKIRLIEPKSTRWNVYSHVKLMRLGLPIIGAALNQSGHDVRIYVEELGPIDWDDVYSSDLVGLSCITATAPQTYKYSDMIRKRGIPTIIGGVHATFCTEEALNHSNYVAKGESGELLMLELINVMNGNGKLEEIPGLAYWENGYQHVNTMRSRPKDLDSLPYPDLDLIVNNERIATKPFITSLGCPEDCDFCSVKIMFGQRYRCRSIENVVSELKQKKPDKVFFYDDNFGASKVRLRRLLERIIEEDLKFSWSAQVEVSIALKQKRMTNLDTGKQELITQGPDKELLELMQKSGCWLVYMGLESVSDETLKAYNKSQNVRDIEKSVGYLNYYGIGTHGMFVVGADTDNQDVVKATVKFAQKHHLYSIMLNILTPLPGTPFYDRMKAAGRIIDENWEHYDAHHVVFRPRNLTPYELQREVIKGYSRFYAVRHLPEALIRLKRVKSKLLLRIMGYMIVRSWKRDARNSVYIDTLKTV